MPIQYSEASGGTVNTNNNTTTIRTNVPGKASSAPATGFPLKIEQIQNVNTKHGIPNGAVLRFDKDSGMWEPVEYTPGSPVTPRRFNFTNSLEWLIRHDMGTTVFKKSLFLEDGTEFSAKTKIIDSNSFVVYLTAAESGWVDVIFGA